MKINVALLEDEQSEREQTESMLRRFFAELNIEVGLTCFSDAESFLSNGSGFKDFQLLLMDIILPDGQPNGVELAREVRKVNRDIAIMFITKTVQFAINGYEVDAVDYVCHTRRQEHKPHTPSSIIKLTNEGVVTIIRP